ncbi:hypothetical protein A1F94_009162 [Pyrenophora tritici-repentis]|nr:hypothetical protein A1F94_009162 [Pyrenophora tritici-repentis]
MAPTSITSTSSDTPTALPINTQPAPPSGFSGDDFINNLGSDLAPLLTLFGEQVTKQFLTMSLGWADNILLAVGPLGIITIIVSAIRVGRVSILKALVGRARESLTTAELEILSSTSENSSELWAKEGTVRVLGKAPVLELIVYSHSEAEIPDEIQVGDLRDAYADKALTYLSKSGQTQTFEDAESLDRLVEQPPNITLNINKAITTNGETWSLVAFGVAIQTVALVVPAIMTYHWKEKKDGELVQDYAYPIFLAGSLALIIGIALCSHIIEATSVEHTFKKEKPNVKSIIYLQMACTMGDQTFGQYLLSMGNEKECIRTSRSDFDMVRQWDVWFAVVTCLLGFVCQFVGLRALHWSATVTQLGVTLIMTATRAWIRRGISRPPIVTPIDTTDLDWIALKLGQACLSIDSDTNFFEELHSSGTHSFAPYTSDNGYRTIEHLWHMYESISQTKEITITHPCFDVRRKIHDILPIGSDYGGLSLSLYTTTAELYDEFLRWNPWVQVEPPRLTWLHLMQDSSHAGSQSFFMLRLFQYTSEDYDAYATRTAAKRLHALLTLWTYGFNPYYSLDARNSTSFLRCVELLPLRDVETLKESLRLYICSPMTDGIGHQDTSIKTIPISAGQGYEDGSPIFGMSRERVWQKEPTRSNDALLVSSFPYSLQIQCALDIISGCVDAIVKQILKLSLEGNPPTIAVVVALAKNLSWIVWKRGPVDREEEAMMLKVDKAPMKRIQAQETITTPDSTQTPLKQVPV